MFCQPDNLKILKGEIWYFTYFTKHASIPDFVQNYIFLEVDCVFTIETVHRLEINFDWVDDYIYSSERDATFPLEVGYLFHLLRLQSCDAMFPVASPLPSPEEWI